MRSLVHLIGIENFPNQKRKVMKNSYEENALIARKIEPVPPSLPGPSKTTTNHQKGCMLNKNRSALIGRNCSARESWDGLFDEAYRADVEIHTDGDTIIYAHASILVSLKIIVLIFRGNDMCC